jgi:hypothetical protein
MSVNICNSVNLLPSARVCTYLVQHDRIEESMVIYVMISIKISMTLW